MALVQGESDGVARAKLYFNWLAPYPGWSFRLVGTEDLLGDEANCCCGFSVDCRDWCDIICLGVTLDGITRCPNCEPVVRAGDVNADYTVPLCVVGPPVGGTATDPSAPTHNTARCFFIRTDCGAAEYWGFDRATGGAGTVDRLVYGGGLVIVAYTEPVFGTVTDTDAPQRMRLFLHAYVSGYKERCCDALPPLGSGAFACCEAPPRYELIAGANSPATVFIAIAEFDCGDTEVTLANGQGIPGYVNHAGEYVHPSNVNVCHDFFQPVFPSGSFRASGGWGWGGTATVSLTYGSGGTVSHTESCDEDQPCTETVGDSADCTGENFWDTVSGSIYEWIGPEGADPCYDTFTLTDTETGTETGTGTDSDTGTGTSTGTDTGGSTDSDTGTPSHDCPASCDECESPLPGAMDFHSTATGDLAITPITYDGAFCLFSGFNVPPSGWGWEAHISCVVGVDGFAYWEITIFLYLNGGPTTSFQTFRAPVTLGNDCPPCGGWSWWADDLGSTSPTASLECGNLP